MGDATDPQPFGLHAALTRHTGFLINRIALMARRGFAARMESIGLTVRLWGVLNVLDAEGALTQHALGKCVGIDPSSMVSAIDELEAKGLVERRRHPHDRRAHALHLTELGRTTLEQGRGLARQAHDELVAPLSARERDQLHDMLLRVAVHADEIAQAEAAAAAEQATGDRAVTGAA